MARSRANWRMRTGRPPATSVPPTLTHVFALLLLLALLTGCTTTPTPTPTPLGGVGQYPVQTLPPAPLGITADPDGAVWFSDAYDIGRITPTGTVTTFPLPRPTPTDPSGRLVPVPKSITLGSDGALWFTDIGTDQIERITPAGVVTEFALSPRFSAITQVITASPDGALWFTRVARRTGEAGDAIGRITTSGMSTLFALPTNANPAGITTGPDGALWFTEAGAIGRITPAGSISSFPLPAGSGAARITTGPDGALWFTANGPSGAIGGITPSGTIREFPVLYRGSSYLWGIVAGPDQALWFTETFGPILGHVTVAGVFTDLDVMKSRGSSEGPQVNCDPREIVVGPDGGLWFIEFTIRAIGHFVFSSPAEHVMVTVHGGAVAR